MKLPGPNCSCKYLRALRFAKLLMDTVFLVLVYIALGLLVLLGASTLLEALLKALQRRGVGKWLFAPFRAWTGLDKTRGPKL